MEEVFTNIEKKGEGDMYYKSRPFHKVTFKDGKVMYVCDLCGGWYTNEKQASKIHFCKSRPK